MAATERFSNRASRVCAWLSLAFVLSLPSSAFGESSLTLTTRGATYQDDDDTEVTTGVVALDATAFDHARLGAGALVDIVSSASVDVVSSATGTFHETRNEYDGHAGYFDSTGSLTLSYRRSAENDWVSDTATLGAARDFFDHNLTLGLTLGVTDNRVGRADDVNFRRSLMSYSGVASAVVVLGRDDILALTYALSLLDGYQSSPYRFVRFLDTTAGSYVTQPETTPPSRVRHALVLRHNRHLFSKSALRSHARAYVDDWGMLSGTLGTEYVHGLGPFEPSLFVRGYAQSPASFYEDRYPSRRQYMTADRELSPFWDVFLGLGVSYRVEPLAFLEHLAADLRATGFQFEFLDFSRLPSRRGFTLELGLEGAL